VFLNRRAAARYRGPGINYIWPSSYKKKNLPGRCLTNVESHWSRKMTSLLLFKIRYCPLIYLFIYSFIHSFILSFFFSFFLSFINGSTAIGPGLFFSFVIFFTQTVGRLGRRNSPSQGRYLHTEQHKHRINVRRHPCLEWDSNSRSQRPSE
jgi:hypothetical protein